MFLLTDRIQSELSEKILLVLADLGSSISKQKPIHNVILQEIKICSFILKTTKYCTADKVMNYMYRFPTILLIQTNTT
jgi:hypothetical protein